MIILGLNHGEINSSAALLKNGVLLAAAPEERFNRQKRTKAFPKRAVEYCLDTAKMKMENVDFVAQAWNPGAYWRKFNPLYSGNRILREDNFYSIPDHLLNFTERKPMDWVLMDFPKDSGLPPIYHVQHHRAHAAAAFFLSPFENAAICTMDYRGEYECTTLSLGTGNKIELFAKQEIPHSLGMFYATYTQLLGYQPDGDEWKVMAISAYEVDCAEMVDKIRSTVKLLDQGRYELDESYYRGANLSETHLYSDRLVSLLGGKIGKATGEPDEWSIRVAKAMQLVSEEIATHVLCHLHKITNCPNIVLGGGYFMNCVFNGRVLDKTPFKRLHVSYAPADVGNSMGAALFVAHCLKNEKRDLNDQLSYLGPEFSDDAIESVLKRRRVPYTVPDQIERHIAEVLARGEIVAVFNGRMEFGERALGNRSILADPRQAEMKDRINAMIKYREGYRPFAPACLEEKAPEFFEVEPGYTCRHMEKVVKVRESKRKLLPAVTHFDGSGRIQTVSSTSNPRFHRTILEFEKITGIPIVVNTSFNINGEPVVLSPDDALNTFFNSGLEFLALGRFFVQKSQKTLS